MIALAFAITVLIFFTPVIGLWHMILGQNPLLRLSLFGFIGKLALPGMDIILLVLLSLLTWALTALILFAIEYLLKKDLLETLGLRNGMLYAIFPKYAKKGPMILAKIVTATFGAIVAIKMIFRALLLIGSLANLIPGFNLAILLQTIIGFLDQLLSINNQVVGLIIGSGLLICDRLTQWERRQRYLNGLRKNRSDRHKAQKEINITPEHEVTER